MAKITKQNSTPGMIKESVNLANLARARKSVQAGIRKHIAQQECTSPTPVRSTPKAIGMFKNIYHSIRNFLLYKKPRHPNKNALRDLKSGSCIDNVKRTITNIMLYGVGMKVVDSEDNTISPRVYLTPCQHEIKNLAEEHGFMVGFL